MRLFTRKPKEDKKKQPSWCGQAAEGSSATVLDDDPLRQCRQLERYGIIVNDPDRWEAHAEGESIYQSALARLDERFALVPEGFVSLSQTLNGYPGCPEVDVQTQPFVLSRWAVTNEEFGRFVATGGYDELGLWEEEIWPCLIDFCDLTGSPGPRFWEHGRYDLSLADHPVTGICYYEAAAYARWAGYRLSTEAEWQMAASWRLRSSSCVLRRYPWGDMFDSSRCNVWASGVGGTVPVDTYASDAAPNGVVQLTGNVWEWTSSDFAILDDEGRTVVGDMQTKSIRGGAFDTYFASQATSHFRTGLGSLVRAHNVGFRCAMDA